MAGQNLLSNSNGTWHWTYQTGGRAYDMGYKWVVGDDGALNIRDAQGNSIKTLCRDYCTDSQAERFYPVCVNRTSTSYIAAAVSV